MKTEKLFMSLVICTTMLAVFGLFCINNVRGTTIEKLWRDELLQTEDSKDNEDIQRDKQNEYTGELPPFNLLLLGLDKDGFRTDVIIFASYNPKGKTINMLSIPRDTKVYYNQRVYKINSLYGVNKETSIVKKVQEISGKKINYYVTLDFDGFRKVIDAFDGVEIDVPTDLKYDDPYQDLHINLKKGLQVLDGNEAEQFVRFRKGNRNTEGYSDGDLSRINAQQTFIEEFIRQKLNIKYLSRSDRLFDIAKEHAKTNVEFSNISPYISQLRSVKGIQLNSHMIPGTSVYENHIWYYIIDKRETEKIINSF